MERKRVIWTVGLALSLSGCAGTGQSRVADSSPTVRERMSSLLAWRQRQPEPEAAAGDAKPSQQPRESLSARLLAWRHRQPSAPAEAAKAGATADPTVAAAAAAVASDPWPAPKAANSDKLSQYFPLLNRGQTATAAGPAPRDAWAEAARASLAMRQQRRPGPGGRRGFKGGAGGRVVGAPGGWLEVGGRRGRRSGRSRGPSVPRPRVGARRAPSRRAPGAGAPDPATESASLPDAIEAVPGVRVERASAESAATPVRGPSRRPAEAPETPPRTGPAPALSRRRSPRRRRRRRRKPGGGSDPRNAAVLEPPTAVRPRAARPRRRRREPPPRRRRAPEPARGFGRGRGRGPRPRMPSAMRPRRAPPLPSKQMPGPVYAGLARGGRRLRTPPGRPVDRRPARPRPRHRSPAPATGRRPRPLRHPRDGPGWRGSAPVSPYATPIDTTWPVGVPFPAAYYVNPGARPRAGAQWAGPVARLRRPRFRRAPRTRRCRRPRASGRGGGRSRNRRGPRCSRGCPPGSAARTGRASSPPRLPGRGQSGGLNRAISRSPGRASSASRPRASMTRRSVNSRCSVTSVWSPATSFWSQRSSGFR